jgi:hypothetical protein
MRPHLASLVPIGTSVPRYNNNPVIKKRQQIGKKITQATIKHASARAQPCLKETHTARKIRKDSIVYDPRQQRGMVKAESRR